MRRSCFTPAFLLVIVAVSGCGGQDDPKGPPGLPADAAAMTNGVTIARRSYDERRTFETFRATVRRRPRTGGPLLAEASPELLTLRPPYRNCLESERGRSGGSLPDKVLLQRCKLLPDFVRTLAIGSLLKAVRVQQEARRLNVTVNNADVDAAWPRYLDTTISGRRYLAAFERLTGLDEAFLRADLRNMLLDEGVRAEIVKQAHLTPVDDADLRKAYRTRRDQIGQPEFRRIRVVISNTLGRSTAARRALDQGTPFDKVIAKYSDDPGNRQAGGRMAPVRLGSIPDPAAERAVFKTPKGKFAGPFRFQGRYSVILIERVFPEVVPPLRDIRPQLRAALTTERDGEVVGAWERKAIAAQRARTTCDRAIGKGVPECGSSAARPTR